MKTMLKQVFLVTLIVISQLSLVNANTDQTEQYAIINVTQTANKNYISITIGANPSEEKEFVRENKTASAMPVVVAEMEKLNKMGYVLFSSSTAIIPFGMEAGGSPVYTFVFIKRK